MKQLVLGAALFVLIAVAVSAHVPAEIVEPGVGPNSGAYWIDIGFENVKLFFTFDREEKIRIMLEVAGERIAEANREAEKKGDASKALENHKELMEKVQAQLDRYLPEDKQKEAEFIKSVADELTSHAIVLEDFISEHENEGLKELLEQNSKTLKVVVLREAELPESEESAEIDKEVKELNEELNKALEDTEDADAIDEAMDETVEDKNENDELEIEIEVKVGSEGSEVTVTGDEELDLKLNTTETTEIISRLSEILGMSEDRIRESIHMEFESGNGKLEVTATVEGDEITRITIVKAGKEQKIVLAIIEKEYVVEEIAKRTKLSIEQINDVLVWNDD